MAVSCLEQRLTPLTDAVPAYAPWGPFGVPPSLDEEAEEQEEQEPVPPPGMRRGRRCKTWAGYIPHAMEGDTPTSASLPSPSLAAPLTCPDFDPFEETGSVTQEEVAWFGRKALQDPNCQDQRTPTTMAGTESNLESFFGAVPMAPGIRSSGGGYSKCPSPAYVCSLASRGQPEHAPGFGGRAPPPFPELPTPFGAHTAPLRELEQAAPEMPSHFGAHSAALRELEQAAPELPSHFGAHSAALRELEQAAAPELPAHFGAHSAALRELEQAAPELPAHFGVHSAALRELEQAAAPELPAHFGAHSAALRELEQAAPELPAHFGVHSAALRELQQAAPELPGPFGVHSAALRELEQAAPSLRDLGQSAPFGGRPFGSAGFAPPYPAAGTTAPARVGGTGSGVYGYGGYGGCGGCGGYGGSQLTAGAPKASTLDDSVTTLMIQNLPRHISQRELLIEVDKQGFAGLYNFCHLPVSFDTRKNKGFAFINFVSVDVAQSFLSVFHDSFEFANQPLDKALRIVTAEVQGFKANAAKAQSKKMRRVRNANFKPVLAGSSSTQWPAASR